jgi:hypothetical protein
MLGVLAILTGLWAEYRNRAGYRSGKFDGAALMLFSLRDKNLIEIDDKGIVKAKQTISEAIDVR